MENNWTNKNAMHVDTFKLTKEERFVKGIFYLVRVLSLGLEHMGFFNS